MPIRIFQNRTLRDIEGSLVYSDTTDLGIEQYNALGSVDPEYVRRFTLDAGDVEEWRIRGVWYLDKRQGSCATVYWAFVQ